MPVRAHIAFVALLALVAAACGGGAVVAEGGTQPPPDEAPQVLDFDAPLLGGGSLRGETLAGRDVAFWFWAPW